MRFKVEFFLPEEPLNYSRFTPALRAKIKKREDPITSMLGPACGFLGVQVAAIAAFEVHSNAEAFTVAYTDGKPVGVFFWRYMHGPKDMPRAIKTLGTWVSPPYRRAGVARRLWDAALRNIKPQHVECDVVSPEGKRFAERQAARWIRRGVAICINDNMVGY
mgnify:CR=1 FL=1